jgi:hypothetical protein
MLTGVIFCESDNFVSKQIKAITHEDDSHVALLFGETVLHFRFLGFESMALEEFKLIYDIHSILCPEVGILVSEKAVIDHYHGKAYDFLGMIYVGVFLLFRDILGITLPGGNYWQNKRDRFCVEFAAEICLGVRGSMWTPTQFRHILLNKNFKILEK